MPDMPKIYIVNVAAARERRAFQQRQMAALGIDNFSFYNALTPADITPDITKKHSGDYKRPLHLTELAYYYTQRALWQSVISDNAPALLLDDDALLSRKLPVALPALAAAAAYGGGGQLQRNPTWSIWKRTAKRNASRAAANMLAMMFA